jgi:hypothetical protein
VILARKGAKSRRRITSLRSKTTKARTEVATRLRAANADLKKKLAEALEQQAATSEVLRVISSSPGELEPVFQAMLENATRLCEADSAALGLCEGGDLRRVARYNAPAALLQETKRDPIFRPGPASGVGRSIRLKQSSCCFVQARETATGVIVIDISAVLDCADAINNLSSLIEVKTHLGQVAEVAVGIRTYHERNLGFSEGAAVDFVSGSVVAQPMEKKGTTPYVTHFIFRPLMSIDIPGLGTATNLEAVGTL